jgi:hypothetical protein
MELEYPSSALVQKLSRSHGMMDGGKRKESSVPGAGI